MDPLQYAIIAGITIGVLVVIFIIANAKFKKRPQLDIDAIIDAIGKQNVREVSYKRNKINVVLLDHKKTNKEALKQAGAVGINVIGNKIKFYFDDDTEIIYEHLKDRYDANA